MNKSGNVLLYGKKVVVVEDDEQISPQSIGTKQEDVYELVRRHLTAQSKSCTWGDKIVSPAITSIHFVRITAWKMIPSIALVARAGFTHSLRFERPKLDMKTAVLNSFQRGVTCKVTHNKIRLFISF